MPSSSAWRAHVGHGDLRRLLHDVAQLAGEGQALGAFGHAGLDEEDVTPGAGHGEAGRHAGHAGAVGRLEEEVRPSEPLSHIADRRRRSGAVALTGGELGRRLAQQSPDLALEVPHAGFPGVVGHDGSQRLVDDLDLVVTQRRPRELAIRPGGGLRDRDLLVLGVAVEPDDLHAVEQRTGDRVEHVGGRDEHHPRQVEVNLEVVVTERVVLRRVEHLEQRRRGVAAVVGAELVDLVEDDDRVHGPGLA